MQNPTFCVYFKRSQTSPLDFKKTADNTHPWGFTIAVYTPKVEGKDLIVLTIDEKPGKVFLYINE